MQKLPKATQASEQVETKYQLFSLYKGRVQVKFYPQSHQYWVSIDGSEFKRKTGVTTYLGIKDKSKALMIWQQGVTADYLLNLLDQKIKINADRCLEAVVQSEV